jgi:hypothetical protein
MKLRFSVIVLVAMLFLSPGTVMAERTVVLAASEHCPVSDLSNLDIRKAYLGISVSVDGISIQPSRLTSDPELNRVFFQTVVAMSEKSYEKRALSLTVKFGTPRPEEFDHLAEALEFLGKTACGVIVLWVEDAAMNDDVKIIKVIWQGD